eukprot:6067860-Heterocapsa_arctica.AAC.1
MPFCTGTKSRAVTMTPRSPTDRDCSKPSKNLSRDQLSLHHCRSVCVGRRRWSSPHRNGLDESTQGSTSGTDRIPL